MIETVPHIRVATRGDAVSIEDLVVRALAEYHQADPVMHEGYLRYSMEPEHAIGAEQLVAELDGQIVGSVLFDRRVQNRPGWPDSVSTFGTLAVDPTIRRRGIGARLVESCIDRAMESGATGVIIETMPFMQAGLEFYGPFGFERWKSGDWDGTDIVRSLVGRPDVPETILSAWRLDFD